MVQRWTLHWHRAPQITEVLLAGAATVPCRLGISVTSLIQDEQRVSVGSVTVQQGTTISRRC